MTSTAGYRTYGSAARPGYKRLQLTGWSEGRRSGKRISEPRPCAMGIRRWRGVGIDLRRGGVAHRLTWSGAEQARRRGIPEGSTGAAVETGERELGPEGRGGAARERTQVHRTTGDVVLNREGRAEPGLEVQWSQTVFHLGFDLDRQRPNGLFG